MGLLYFMVTYLLFLLCIFESITKKISMCSWISLRVSRRGKRIGECITLHEGVV